MTKEYSCPKCGSTDLISDAVIEVSVNPNEDPATWASDSDPEILLCDSGPYTTCNACDYAASNLSMFQTAGR